MPLRDYKELSIILGIDDGRNALQLPDAVTGSVMASLQSISIVDGSLLKEVVSKLFM